MDERKMELELRLFQLRQQQETLEGPGFDLLSEVIEEEIAKIEAALEEET